ncbi:MAG: peptide chain release factor 2 [Janthinobacterium lividum]
MLEDVVKAMEEVEARLNALSQPLNLEGRVEEINGLEAEAGNSAFWDDPTGAQAQMQRLNQLKESLAPWQAVRKRLDDTKMLAELAGMEESPEAYEPEIKDELASITVALDKLEVETLLSGPHDSAPAILEINAGAGGADANDWTSILQRMYLRWSDRHGFKVDLLDEVEGDVAGLKSTTLRIEGKNAYGLLQGEQGIHRLVRISPFNKTRETSFAGVNVVPETAEVEEVDIPEKDLKTDYFRASGAGGQHVNKTSSAVRITHLPTGIVVSCQNERSQGQNRAFAMNVLKSKLLALAQAENKAGIDELRGDRKDIAFGHQTRNYVFQPYTLVKDTRTAHETGDIQRVMNGEFDDFIDDYLRWQQAQKTQDAL